MFILLLTILVVGLIITFAGFVLSSPKTRVPAARRAVYAEQSVRVRRASASMKNRQLRTRQFALDVEPRGWTNIFASINTNSIVSIFTGRRASQQFSWFLLAVVLLLLLAFEFYFSALLHPGLMLVPWGRAAATTTVNRNSGSKNAPPPELFSSMVGASKALKRIGQLDPSQYNSAEDYNTWAYSTCSAAAMTEVINSYGHNYRIANILKVEAGLGEITPALGLVEPEGIDHTVARFGFNTWWLAKPSLDQVITVANHGHPVIVNFPPSRWAGGHVLVVIGGDNNYVYTADSSSLNMQAFTHQNFLKYWIDFAAVAMPK